MVLANEKKRNWRHARSNDGVVILLDLESHNKDFGFYSE